jgi:kinesin family protein 18/19
MQNDEKVNEKLFINKMIVAVRVRPLTQQEKSAGIAKAVHVLDKNWLVLYDKVSNHVNSEWSRQRGKDKHYEFDVVLSETSSQFEVFMSTCEFLIEGTLNGYNSSVFAYGPTGSGKSFTMIGEPDDPGLIFQTLLLIYDDLEKVKKEKEFKVSVGFLEIYNENIRDLLNPSHDCLDIREDPTKGVTVAGLTEKIVASIDDVSEIITLGTTRRVSEPTKANQVSSRSHAVLTINVEARERVKTENNEILYGKLSLVDLAGSERASKTKNKGLRLFEGANINRSLLSLANCINALAESATRSSKPHVPYRDSKLTRLLKDSLGGNCRTVMITCISPAFYNYEDTINTLAYANRAKTIKSKARKNVINVQEHISKYSEIINKLKNEVKSLRDQLGNKITSGPKIDNFLIIINEHFKEEADLRKSIYLNKEKIASLGFKMFELQTQLFKNSDASPKVKNSTQCEIEKVRKQIIALESEEIENNKKLEKLEFKRNDMETTWINSGADDSSLAQLKLELKNHTMMMNSLDFRGQASSNKLVIEQKDMYIKFLEEQLRLRDFMISKETPKTNENLLKSYKSYEEISSFFLPSSLSSPHKDSNRSSLPSIPKSRIPRITDSPKRIKITFNESKPSRIKTVKEKSSSQELKETRIQGEKKRKKEIFYSQKYGRGRIMSLEPDSSAASTNLTLPEKKPKQSTISEKYQKSPFIKSWKISLSPKEKLK